MSRKLSFDADALNSIHEGVYFLSKAVKTTLGPKGRNVLIHKEYGSPNVTKDGITVAKEVKLSNPIAQMAADLVKEAADNTLENAGDGTTSTTVLTEAIFSESSSYLNGDYMSLWYSIKNHINPSRYPIPKFGSNAMDLKRGIDLASKEVISKLKSIATPIKSNLDIFNVAKISGNNDDEIGNLISEAVEKVGHSGVIQTEDSKDSFSSVKLVEGMTLDRGLLSMDFSTNEDRSLAEYTNPHFFIYGGVLTSVQTLLRSVEICMQAEVPLVIIADDYDPNVLNFLLRNKLQAQAKLLPIKSPGMGDQKLQLMKDISAVTGCKTLEKDNYNNIVISDLGIATRITVSKSTTTLISDPINSDLIKSRVNMIKAELPNCDIESIKLKMETRIAQLEGKLAIISIGAPTESELKEKKDRLDDALSATKSAIEEGIIPGSGLALLRISEDLKNLSHENEDINLGIKAVLKAIKVPAYAILENAGLSPNSIISNILKSKSKTWGFNSLTESYMDLIESGVIDPVKVTRLAVKNAASIAGLLLTTGCIISKDK